MKILITGCNGQLGTEMRNVLEGKMPGKTIYTDVAELDLTDAEAVKSFVTANDITHIVNCAAYTAVDKAESDQGLCSRINVDAVKISPMRPTSKGQRWCMSRQTMCLTGLATLPTKNRMLYIL